MRFTIYLLDYIDTKYGDNYLVWIKYKECNTEKELNEIKKEMIENKLITRHDEYIIHDKFMEII